MVTQESTSERTLAEEITLLMEALPAQEETAKAAIKEMTSAESAQILGLAKVALAAESVVEKANARIASLQYKIDNAARIAKQGEVAEFNEGIQKHFIKIFGNEVPLQMTELEVTDVVVTVQCNDGNDSLDVKVRSTGPGVVAVRKSERGGLGNGRSWATILTNNGVDLKGGSAHKIVATKLPDIHTRIHATTQIKCNLKLKL